MAQQSINNNQMDKQVKIAFSIIVLLRVLQIFLDYNYDWPDEHWQGPQIAYKMVNGYGFQTWEWIMQRPIRNIIYQAYLSIGYLIANSLNFSAINKQRSVRIMQIFLAILCDWFLLKISLFYTKKLTMATCLLILSNWFYFSMMNRTYINSIQTCLSVVSFYYWLIRDRGLKYDILSRLTVGVNFIIRTTSILLWVVIWPYELITMKANRIKFISKNLIQIVLMVLFSIGINSLWYGKLTIVQLNFFNFNIFLKWSDLYGISPYFYYFYYAIPLIMAPYLLPFVISLFTIFTNNSKQLNNQKNTDENKGQDDEHIHNKRFKNLIIIVLISLIILSFVGHKQPRFILILTPFFLILSIKGIKKFQNRGLLMSLLIMINFCFFLVLGIYGKNGGVKILRQIRQDIRNNHSNNFQDIALIYLCEPHSLPSFSILQQNITLKLLDTSPTRKLQHFHEQDQLKRNPQALFKQLQQGLNSKSIIYLIIQEKYSILNGRLRQEYQFLLQNNFSLMKSYRNINLWQQYQHGYDGFVLLKKS